MIGSVEAILDVLETYESKQCKLDIIHYGIGNVSVTDIEYADAFKGKFHYLSYFKTKINSLIKNINVFIQR